MLKSALLVPKMRIKWTQAIRMTSGISASAAILSSRNNLSVRMKRPAIRSRIIRAQKDVAHQQTSSVGLSRRKGHSSGASE